jgi:acetoacetate decarboxylase
VSKVDREVARLNEADVKVRAFAMPLTSPAFPPGPYRFVDREYLIITYRTNPDALRAIYSRAARDGVRDRQV